MYRILANRFVLLCILLSFVVCTPVHGRNWDRVDAEGEDDSRWSSSSSSARFLRRRTTARRGDEIIIEKWHQALANAKRIYKTHQLFHRYPILTHLAISVNPHLGFFFHSAQNIFHHVFPVLFPSTVAKAEDTMRITKNDPKKDQKLQIDQYDL